MTDSIEVLPPGWRATDDSGTILPGAVLRFYEAGTSTPLAVYSDSDLSTSLGSIITCDSSGYPTSDGATRVLLYTGTDPYKVVLTDADAVTIWTHDDVRGATPSPATSSTATPVAPVTALTTTYTVTTADRGKAFQCVCTGGTFVVTLPSAVTAGDNWLCWLLHDGSANAVTISTVSSQTITYRGKARTSVTLLGRGEAMLLVSNGAQWLAFSTGSNAYNDAPGVLVVQSRTNTPPGGPTAGARYIVTTSPTGAWSALAVDTIVEADGAGSWLSYAPTAGMLAWSVGDGHFYKYSSGWTSQSGMERPTALTIPVAVFLDQKASGTAGGNGTASAWTTSTVNTTQSNGISGASLGSNQITLPTGSYRVDFSRTFFCTKNSQLRFRSTTDGAKIYYSDQAYASENPSSGGGTYHQTSVVLTGSCIVTVTAATEVFDLQYYIEQTFTDGLGKAASRSVAETYATVTVQALSVTATWP